MASMEEALGYLIFVVVGFAAVVAVGTLAGSGKLYDEIGRGGLSLDDEVGRRPAPARGSAAAARERDEELRQLVTARNHRRAARGEATLDVEAELRRLTAPVVDDALRDEVRSLVVARNERRATRGQAPLDVEVEVERQLRDAGA